MNRLKNLLPLAFVALLPLAGCSSAEDNPVTPDKMNAIRQKESQDRGNFHPDTTNPPTKTGG